MTDLIDEVKNSFRNYQDGQRAEAPVVLRADADLGVGFAAMREYYMTRLVAQTRRGYQHFAGSTMPTDPAELVMHTSSVMVPALIDCLVHAFTDGVLIAHQDDTQVKISHHFGLVDALFSDANFRETSHAMASGFTSDAEVSEFFNTYVTGCLKYLATVSGFIAQEDLTKIWDVWLLTGNATTASAYLAGIQLGTAWYERDVLTEIEIATESPHESEGEDEGGR